MRRPIPARVISLVLVLLGGALFVRPANADGVTGKEQEVKDDLAHISQLQQKASALNEEYLGYLSQISDLNAQIATGQQQIAQQQSALDALQTQLANVAVQQFTGGSGEGIATLFGGTDAVTDGLSRQQLLGVAVDAGSVSTDDYDQLLRQLTAEQNTLQAKQDKATKLAKQASDASAKTVEAGAAYQAELTKDQAQLGVLLAQEQQRQLEAAAAAHAAEVAAIHAREQATADAAAKRATADAATNTTEAASRPAATATTAAATTATAAASPASGGSGSPSTSEPTKTTAPAGASGTHQTSPPTTSPPTTSPPDNSPAAAGDSGGNSTSDTTNSAANVAVAVDPGSSSNDTSSSSSSGSSSSDPGPPAVSSRAAIAVEAARSQLGVPYKFAMSSPGVAFDCSGLTSYAWRVAGVAIPHQSAQQFASTPHVPLSDIQPGDLLYYYHPISHVAIYIGNGQIIQAPAPGKFVEIAPVNWGSIVGASRPG